MAACLDNHLNRGNALDIDLENIYFKIIDTNDRALRNISIGHGKINGPQRNSSFQITVASEIMAILCLAENISDLKNRIGNILVAKNTKGDFIYVKDLKIQGAVGLLY